MTIAIQQKLENYLHYLSQDENNLSLLLNISNLYLELGDIGKAQTYLDKASIINPKACFAAQSILNLSRNEFDLAQHNIQQALSINPDSYENQVIDLLLRAATLQASTEEIEPLLQINPEDSRLWFALGSVYMTQKNMAQAIPALEKALKIEPQFYDCYIALAWGHLFTNQLELTMTDYQKALSIKAQGAEGFAGLALVYALKEELESAHQFMEKANNINPDCFLTKLAEIICFNYSYPQKAQSCLISALKNEATPFGEKLALIIQELQNTTAQTLH